MPARNFVDQAKALEDAFNSKDMFEYWRLFRVFCSKLDEQQMDSDASVATARSSVVPPQIQSWKNAQVSKSAITRVADFTGVASSTSQIRKSADLGADLNSEGLRAASVATDEAVIPGAAITVYDEVCWLATAADKSKPCHGICVRGTGVPGRVFYQPLSALVEAIVVIPLTNKGPLWLSVVPGKLTDNDAESPATRLIRQELGLFHSLITDKLGSVGRASVSFRWSPPIFLS